MGAEGLLIGLSEALKSGVTSYNEARDRKMREKQYNQGLLKEGYEETPEGGLVMTPEAQQRQAFDRNQKTLTQKREAMEHGLLPKTDASGNITDFERDPNYVDEAKMLRGLQIQDLSRKIKDEQTSAKPEQAKAAGYAQRIQDAQGVFSGLTDKGYHREAAGKDTALTSLPLVGGLLKPLASGEYKQQEQAERNFVNAILRRESGSAIAPSEFESAEKQYFPRVGDTPEVLAQKDQNRNSALRSLKLEAGSAMDKMGLMGDPITGKEKAIAGQLKKGGIVATDSIPRKIINGIHYIKSSGGWEESD